MAPIVNNMASASDVLPAPACDTSAMFRSDTVGYSFIAAGVLRG
jgi:hypothetical protein